MEREYIAHHIKRRFRGIEHLTASKQPKYLEDYLKHSIEDLEALDEMFRALEALEDAFRSTRRLQNSTTKSLGACQTRGSGTDHRHRMF